jgi:hypothetical protein
MTAKVDEVDRSANAGEQRLDELGAASHQRVDGAVVISVGVHVEKPGRLRHRVA